MIIEQQTPQKSFFYLIGSGESTAFKDIWERFVETESTLTQIKKKLNCNIKVKDLDDQYEFK